MTWVVLTAAVCVGVWWVFCKIKKSCPHCCTEFVRREWTCIHGRNHYSRLPEYHCLDCGKWWQEGGW